MKINLMKFNKIEKLNNKIVLFNLEKLLKQINK